MEVVELFNKNFKEFRVRFDISQKNTCCAGKVLWSPFMGDAWLLDCDDLEGRVMLFF